jgi:dihydroflavonol-4-reductase
VSRGPFPLAPLGGGRAGERGECRLRYLLTGGTGFIGAALAERLIARGDGVRALVRDRGRAEALARAGAELAPGALGDEVSLAAAVDGCDVVIHLAGLLKARRRRELFAVNGEGTRALAQACARAARAPRLVYVSSLAAAGPSSLERPRSEEDPPAPVSDYGRSKLAGEEAVRAVADRVQASIVRPPIVYGPRDRELVPPLVRMARAGVVLRAGFGDKRYSVVHVEDLCDGILEVAARGRPLGGPRAEGIYFLDDGGIHGWDDIARAACDALGRRARVVPLPLALSWAVAAGAMLGAALGGGAAMLSFDKMREIREPAWTCTSERARRELGFAPRFGLADGMREAVQGYLQSKSQG